MAVNDGLLERQGVTEAVADLVGAVGAGRPGALFVVGEAGLGKTAVLGCGRDLAVAAGLLVGLRPWPGPVLEAVLDLAQEGGARVERLAPLSAGAAEALLAARVGRPVPAEVSRRAGRLCAGNPLLLEQVAVAVGRGEEVPDVGEARSGVIGEGLLLARFAGLPASGMRCVRAASVLGTRFVPEIAALVAGLDGADMDAALESIDGSGLIEQGPGPEAAFIHPLFRQALYDDLGAAMRTRLHARAFGVLAARGLDAVAAAHAVPAHLVGDPQAVAVLERAGRAAHRAGALEVAVARLDAAVELAAGQASPDLLLAQSEALLAAGRADRAVAVYEGLLARPGLPAAATVQARWMLGRALVMTGAHDQAHAAFCAAADLAEDDDPGTAVEVLLLNAAFTSMLTEGPVRALPVASRACQLAGSLGGGLHTRADALWGEIALLAGDPAGMAAAEPAAPWLGSGERPGSGIGMPALAAGWSLINAFAYSALLVERLADADRAASRPGPGRYWPRPSR